MRPTAASHSTWLGVPCQQQEEDGKGQVGMQGLWSMEWLGLQWDG